MVSQVREPTKPSMFDMEIQKKLDVLELAEQLGNVSEAAKISGVSRDTIYRHRRLVEEGGVTALKRQETTDHYHKTVLIRTQRTRSSSSRWTTRTLVKYKYPISFGSSMR